MKIARLLSVLAAVVLPLVAAAQTVQLSYDATFGSASAPLAVGAPAFPVDVELPEFNSDLGTLTGVSLTLTSTVGGSVSVINFTSSAQAFSNAFAQMTVDVTGPDGTAVSISPSAVVASGVAAAGPFVFSDFTPVSGTGSSTAAAANLSLYEAAGGGQLQLAIDSSGVGTYGGSGVPGTVGFSGNANAYGDLKVAYSYIAIPEPSTYAVILGCAALVAAGWRRSRNSAV